MSRKTLITPSPSDEPPGGGTTGATYERASGLTVALAIGLAIIGVARQVLVIRGLTSKLVTEDQTVSWVMARDWGGFRPKELTFYGQSYGTSFDTLPMGLLHRARLPFATAMPVSLVVMTIAGWWSLALAAWKRGWFGASLVALAAPAILTTGHLVVVGAYAGTTLGRLTAASALALLLVYQDRRWAIWAGCSLLGLSLVFDSSSALLVGPVMIWVIFEVVWPNPRRFAPPFVAGGLLPLLYLGVLSWYGGRHPDHELHPEWKLTPDVATLKSNLRAPGGLLDMHALQVAQHWQVVVAALAVIIGLAAVRRRSIGLIASAALVGGLLILMSLPKSLDGFDTIFFDRARLTTSLPLALWFLASLVTYPTAVHVRYRRTAHLIETARGQHFRQVGRSPHRPLLVGLFIVALLSLVTTPRDVTELREQAQRETQYSIATAASIEQRCVEVNQIAQSAATDVVIWVGGPRLAYACAAMFPNLTTLFPSYERRWWVLRQLVNETRTSLFFADVGAGFCSTIPDRSFVVSCSNTTPGAILVTEPMTPLDVINRAGQYIRPFGDDCSPQDPETCTWFNQRFPSS